VSPLPANDEAPEMTPAQALAAASLIRDRIAVMEGPTFGAAVQQLAAETGRACAFPAEEGDGQ